MNNIANSVSIIILAISIILVSIVNTSQSKEILKIQQEIAILQEKINE